MWVRDPLLTRPLISILYFIGNVNGYMIILAETRAGNGILPSTVTKEEKQMLWYTL